MICVARRLPCGASRSNRIPMTCGRRRAACSSKRCGPRGAKVQAYDPVAMPECGRIYGERADLVFCKTSPDALQGADALVIVTEWQEFRSPDFDFIKRTLRSPVIFDGRNLYDPAQMAETGFSYYAVGRGQR